MTKEKKDLHMYSQQQPNQVTKIAFSSVFFLKIKFTLQVYSRNFQQLKINCAQELWVATLGYIPPCLSYKQSVSFDNTTSAYYTKRYE